MKLKILFCALLALITATVSAQTFTNTAPMNFARYWHSGVLLPNGKVLIAGGFDYLQRYLSSAELYDPATGQWTNTGSMNVPRNNFTAVLLRNGKVLVAGGYNSTSNYLSSAELYDPSTGTWTETGSLHVARNWHAAVLLNNGKVLVVGGADSNANGTTSTEIYDPATGIWSSTGPLNVPRQNHSATLLTNGKVLVAGGSTSAGYISSSELYNPDTGIWTMTDPMKIATGFPTATLLLNGQVLITGGISEGRILSDVELYNPDSATWTKINSMNAARTYHSSTLLPNGKVLVAGTWTLSNYSDSSAELYDPITGAWTTVGSMKAARSRQVAILLPNGQVLMAAGVDGPNILASSELFLISPVTLPPSGVTTSAAQLNGSVLPGPGTTAYFQYGLTSAYGKTSPKATLRSDQRNLAFGLTDLLPGTTYHYQIVVSGPAGTISGGDLQLSTLPVATSATSAQVAGTFGLGLRLHSAPSLSSPVLLVMPEGSSVTLLGGTQSADGHLWRNIRFGTQSGWAAAENLTFGLSQSPPSPPVALAQLQADGTTPLPAAGTAPSASVILAAKPVGLANQQFQIQFELRPTGTTFSTPTATSASGSGGSPAQITVPNLPNQGYHWRARSLDGYGQVSDWVSFSTDPTDFTVAAPAVPRAFFSASPQVIFPGDSVQFTATASTQPDLTFAWDFGNGQTATGPNTTQTFPQVGTVVAQLTIADPHGHTTTSTQIINIQSHLLVDAINHLAQNTANLFDSVYVQAADCANAADYFRPGVDSAQAKIALEADFDVLSFGLSAVDFKDLLDLTSQTVIPVELGLSTVADFTQTATSETLDSLYQRHQSPSDILLPPIQSFIRQKKLELEALRMKAIAATAAIPAATADAMAKNLLARYVGNLAISDNYQAKATLPVAYAALKHADEDSFKYILASHLFTFSVGLALDAPGGEILPYAATAVQGSLNIVGLLSQQSTEAQMLGLSMGVLSQTVLNARLMVNNAEQGLQSVIAAQASQTPNSTMSVEHFAMGASSVAGSTPSWVSAAAYDLVTIYNSGNVAADFHVEALYDRTFTTVGLLPVRTFGIGDHEYPLTVVTDGITVHLDPGEQGTTRITYENLAGGNIPRVDITYILTATTADGNYREQSQSGHFGTTHLDANGQVVDAATLPQGLVDTTAPLHATLVQYGDSSIATLNIYLSNPFDTPLLVNLQQPLPPGTTVLDAAGGTLNGTQITWEVDLLPGDLRFLPVSLQLAASPTQSPLAATTASAYDSQNANWLQFSAVPNLLTITNLPAAGLKPLGFASDGFHLQLEPLVPGVYQLQSSTNLSTWAGLTTLTNLQSTVELKDPAALTNAIQFYRAIKTQ